MRLAHAVRERVDTAAHELLRILEVILVRDRAQPVCMRFLDDGAVQLRRKLRILAHAVVDPDLDDVDTERRLLAHAGTRFFHRRNPVRNFGTARLGRREAAAGHAVQRVARDDFAAHRVGVVGVVLAEAHGCADAEVGAVFQISQKARAVARQMHVCVDDRGHDGEAREIDGRRAGRHRHGRRRTDEAEPIVGADRERRVVDDVAVADEQPRAGNKR